MSCYLAYCRVTICSRCCRQTSKSWWATQCLKSNKERTCWKINTCTTCNQPTQNLRSLLHSDLASSYCSNIGDNISAQITEISLFQRARLKIYLFRAIMHNSRGGRGGLKLAERCLGTHTHTLLYTHTRGTYELNLVSQTEFLILSLGIIVRMWSSDRALASKPWQDIRSCWSGTLAMQHPDLKCSSGFVVICSSQLSQYTGALQEHPLSSSSQLSLLSLPKLFNQLIHLCPSVLFNFRMCKVVTWIV